MEKITNFKVTGLHGYLNYDFRLKDNTLILVGENGAGKTTVLRLLYYFISGQWISLVKYKFDELSISIGGKKYTLPYDLLAQKLHTINKRALLKLRPHVRRSLIDASERGSYAEIEKICDQNGIPTHFVMRQIEEPDLLSDQPCNKLSQVLMNISRAFTSQILYLPTYRRIEQELSDIFGEENTNRRHRHWEDWSNTTEEENSYVELIEFGMGDVEQAVVKTLASLKEFARETLNKLSLGYLGEIVEKKYSDIDTRAIQELPDETINNVLGRIQETILSSSNKQNLSKVIHKVKINATLDEHAKVICHYFLKLLDFQKELEIKEQKIRRFCEVCNEYMVGKNFHYDSISFDFAIKTTQPSDNDSGLELKHLSSGEKQIVSLFSHLYLSGKQNFFVLIDEPELSLSVPWQRRFLCDIKKGDFCTGLVAVTHSPFIYENELKQYAHGLGEFLKE